MTKSETVDQNTKLYYEPITHAVFYFLTMQELEVITELHLE